MTWFFGQIWFLILIGFLVGAAVAWAVVKLTIPHVDEVESLASKANEGADR